MSVADVDSFIKRNGIKCVVYGGAGVGKTRLALTCPQPIYISAEKGMLSLRGSGMKVYGEITTLGQLIEAHNWAMNSAEARAFNTVVLDSISELSDNILQAAKLGTKDGRKAHNDTYESVVFKILNAFRDLPQKNVYIIAKERYDEDKQTMLRQFKPSMPNGNLIREVPYKFDYLFRMFDHRDMTTQQDTVWLQCTADVTAVAKDRSGRLAKYEAPHLGQLFAKAMQ